ncbi:hypothetical protein ADK52_25530 [Streptomyces sp. WM6372]|uniref:hypothetical protein n=1 Tax=Streptomyces sp. WM6372 TaxID=1415555 RepID=UPI0006AE7A14|nr:hypothetical protein [Streptomyces sp. WM6372]KOU20951.1 hypothetical protein ADK52_25530 [Streptomyces sp. WM6372]
MTLTTTGLFLLVAVGLGIWMKRDPSFKKREFLAVSLFWVLVVATPWGAEGVAKVQSIIGTGVQTASDTVNSVSSK